MENECHLSATEKRIESYIWVFIVASISLYVTFAAGVYILSAAAGSLLAILSLLLMAKTKHIERRGAGWLLQLMDLAFIAGLAGGVIVASLSLMQMG